ncbi:alpha-ketoglutarate-dependent dioxygenase alkB homolog 4 [Glossina fuscipes fuscipes]
MNTVRPCGCKGMRSCLKCEQDFHIKKVSLRENLEKFESLAYCVECGRFYPGWEPEKVREQHLWHQEQVGIDLPGVVVKENFLTIKEGQQLLDNIDHLLPWTLSQSGRRKQNFGPKTNFKRRKLRNGQFKGFPDFTAFIQHRFKEINILDNFQTIEQCSLEYDPSKGASIDPHIDDCWVWGERVVTVNCLGNAVLTLTLYEEAKDLHNLSKLQKYNLAVVADYQQFLREPLFPKEKIQIFESKVLRIPMPNLSLIVLYGPARYQFEHSVLREDILERRVCLAYREFTAMYLKDGEFSDKGKEILQNSLKICCTRENKI